MEAKKYGNYDFGMRNGCYSKIQIPHAEIDLTDRMSFKFYGSLENGSFNYFIFSGNSSLISSAVGGLVSKLTTISAANETNSAG